MTVEMISFLIFINCLYTGNPLMCTFTNSEDPDEMPHNAAFHQGLHCLLMKKKTPKTFSENYNLTPLDM